MDYFSNPTCFCYVWCNNFSANISKFSSRRDSTYNSSSTSNFRNRNIDLYTMHKRKITSLFRKLICIYNTNCSSLFERWNIRSNDRNYGSRFNLCNSSNNHSLYRKGMAWQTITTSSYWPNDYDYRLRVSTKCYITNRFKLRNTIWMEGRIGCSSFILSNGNCND